MTDGMGALKKQSVAFAIVLGCLIGSNSSAQEPIIGGPCEGCENVFVDMPKELGSQSRITAVDEPGEPMVIVGVVRSLNGEPVEGIIIYAYHTDASGVYPPGATRHGRLRGWARTDENGIYRFDTIRPGSYPGRNNPQHVHMHVIEPGRVTYYIASLVFDDDPLLTSERQRRRENGRGGSGVAHPEKNDGDIWSVRRDITLGQNVPGYPYE
jgi:protocatechuate 3,4-dioxygenase beta subunit